MSFNIHHTHGIGRHKPIAKDARTTKPKSEIERLEEYIERRHKDAEAGMKNHEFSESQRRTRVIACHIYSDVLHHIDLIKARSLR